MARGKAFSLYETRLEKRSRSRSGSGVDYFEEKAQLVTDSLSRFVLPRGPRGGGGRIEVVAVRQDSPEDDLGNNAIVLFKIVDPKGVLGGMGWEKGFRMPGGEIDEGKMSAVSQGLFWSLLEWWEVTYENIDFEEGRPRLVKIPYRNR